MSPVTETAENKSHVTSHFIR